MDVSKNNGKTPQISTILTRFSIIFTIHFGGKIHPWLVGWLVNPSRPKPRPVPAPYLGVGTPNRVFVFENNRGKRENTKDGWIQRFMTKPMMMTYDDD